jgi:serine phosphatase RsbU (regulator of sigma subunit)
VDGYPAVEHALRDASPHLLLEVVTEAVKEQYGATRVDLRIADYAMRSLQTVDSTPLVPDSLPIDGSAEGRAFGAQEPQAEPAPPGQVAVHLPVTIRGDRMGVLSVHVPEDRYREKQLPEMERICEALGHEILVAERDTDLYHVARRTQRLTLAAEMQWQLLPGRSCARREFALGGHLEPAYAIFGDIFDWSASSSRLTLTVTNGMGEGMDAALLSNLAVNALRNARRAGLGVADQAALADQALYAQYRGAFYLSALLMQFDLVTGEVEVVDAGSPRLWRRRDGRVEPVTFEAELPLGMFEETHYTAHRFEVKPGDRLLIATDGVYGTHAPTGENYGDRALIRALAAHRLLPPAQVPRAVLRELHDFRGTGPGDDDALVVCLDWYGRPDPDSDP